MGPATSGKRSLRGDCRHRIRERGRGRGGRRLAGRLLLMLSLASQIAAGCPAPSPAPARLGADPPFSQYSRAGGSLTRTVAGRPTAPTRVALGRSVNGQPLTMQVLGSGPDAVLIIGGIHGDEPTGADVASELESFLRSHPEFLDGHTVGILARANPDGLLRGTRVNARGVDLNRNFPDRNWHREHAGEVRHGSRPASEPETLAVMTAIETLGALIRQVRDAQKLLGEAIDEEAALEAWQHSTGDDDEAVLAALHAALGDV